jgi:hypothetical protein
MPDWEKMILETLISTSFKARVGWVGKGGEGRHLSGNNKKHIISWKK